MVHSALTNQVKNSKQSSSRQGAKIDTFLIHHQASTNDDATINMMVSGSREVSANYTISNTGRLTSVVDESLRAWTSGSSTDGGKGAAWDRRSITVEIANSTGAPDWKISEASITKAAELLNDLKKRYKIKYVLGHRDLWNKYKASYPTYCPGPDTVARIVKKAKELEKKAPKPKYTAAQTASKKLKHPIANQSIKKYNSAVTKVIQRRLQEYGYKLDADGIFGPITDKTVRAFQKKYKIDVDGIVGPQTWKTMKLL